MDRRTVGVITAAVLGAGTAHAEPSDRELVGVGIALALPTYAVDVTLHEGSHAIAALLVGAHVDELHLIPGRDPHIGAFRFGWTYVDGLHTHADRLWFYAAPKLTDLALLGGFAALVYTGAWPHNRFGELALTVAATGSWVDFSKDVVLFSPHTDVMHVFDLWCLRGRRQVPARAVYAGAVVGLGLVVARGYARTFGHEDRATPLFLPIATATF